MAFNVLDFSKSVGTLNRTPADITPSKPGLIPVRVTEVNIKPEKRTTSLFQQMDQYWGLGAIKFEFLKQPTPNSKTSNVTMALPMNASMKILPLVNDIVYVTLGPDRNTKENEQYYYTPSIPVWNSIETNTFPSPASEGNDSTNTNTNAEIQAGMPNTPNNKTKGPVLGDVFKEQGKIRNLYPQEGDFLLEGKFGNSLRFGSTSRFRGDFSSFKVSPQNPWSKNGRVGDPITILRNGQKKEAIAAEVYDPTFEDINDDDSSIYLTSTQNIPLEIAYSKLTSYGVDITPPEDTTKEFQKLTEELGDEFTSNKDADAVTVVTDSINREPQGDVTKPAALSPQEANRNLSIDRSVGDVPREEFEGGS